MKHIAIFADGTWNSPEDDNTTNVIEMARAVKPEIRVSNKHVKQIAFYDWGIGTDRHRIVGGISGVGIDKNILDCYRFLVHNYHPGDKLFFFGFSRGAYTVRSLAGFLRNCGLLKREHADRIPEAYKMYRKRSRNSAPWEPMACRFRKDYAVADLTPIEFVGVWDTVGALGIPVPFWGTLGKREFLFHDTAPSKIVRHARHAIAIDELREDFAHTPWDKKDNMDIKEVWFAGVHADIGGGYRLDGLSHVASQWMIDEAAKFGLELEDHYLKTINPRPNSKLNNSRTGIYRVRAQHIREIDGPIHASVQQRWKRNTDNYRKKSKALTRLLEKHGDDWGEIEIVG